jgi:hypothetical protein
MYVERRATSRVGSDTQQRKHVKLEAGPVAYNAQRKKCD